MLVREANRITGGLSSPGKMPCKGYSLPASQCKVGARLQAVEGSTCHGCYAMKGAYVWPTVKNALERRLEALNHPQWVEAMTTLVSREKSGHFRWHDSGDLQSIDHLLQIVEVVKATPHIKHWLPTREYQIVSQYRAEQGEFPKNLCVRISTHMVDDMSQPLYGLPYSTVHKEQTPIDSVICHAAEKKGGQCGECRKCWNNTVDHVSYKKH